MKNILIISLTVFTITLMTLNIIRIYNSWEDNYTENSDTQEIILNRLEY